MINDKADEFIEENFELSLSKYQIGLKTFMKGSGFIFDSIDSLYCKCYKIFLKRGDHIQIPLIR